MLHPIPKSIMRILTLHSNLQVPLWDMIDELVSSHVFGVCGHLKFGISQKISEQKWDDTVSEQQLKESFWRVSSFETLSLLCPTIMVPWKMWLLNKVYQLLVFLVILHWPKDFGEEGYIMVYDCMSQKARTSSILWVDWEYGSLDPGIAGGRVHW